MKELFIEQNEISVGHLTSLVGCANREGSGCCVGQKQEVKGLWGQCEDIFTKKDVYLNIRKEVKNVGCGEGNFTFMAL